MVGHSLHHITEDVSVTNVARHHVPEVTTPSGVNGPLTENLRDDTVPVPLLPAGGGRDVVGEHLIAVGGECPLVGVVYDVVDVAQPRIHLVAVLEHHFCGELGVRFLVQIVGAGNKEPPSDSPEGEGQHSQKPHLYAFIYAIHNYQLSIFNYQFVPISSHSRSPPLREGHGGGSLEVDIHPKHH